MRGKRKYFRHTKLLLSETPVSIAPTVAKLKNFLTKAKFFLKTLQDMENCGIGKIDVSH